MAEIALLILYVVAVVVISITCGFTTDEPAPADAMRAELQRMKGKKR